MNNQKKNVSLQIITLYITVLNYCKMRFVLFFSYRAVSTRLYSFNPKWTDKKVVNSKICVDRERKLQNSNNIIIIWFISFILDGMTFLFISSTVLKYVTFKFQSLQFQSPIIKVIHLIKHIFIVVEFIFTFGNWVFFYIIHDSLHKNKSTLNLPCLLYYNKYKS